MEGGKLQSDVIAVSRVVILRDCRGILCNYDLEDASQKQDEEEKRRGGTHDDAGGRSLR